MLTAVGIDVGLVLHTPTTGLCRTGACEFKVAHACSDRLSRELALGMPTHVDMLAIDGPVLPSGCLHFELRPVEKVLLWGGFRTRCAVGNTQRGIGAALRRGGCDTAAQFADLTKASDCSTNYPQVQRNRHVIEAFPNAFLGVMLNDEAFPDPMPKIKRGGRFDWLLKNWREAKGSSQLRKQLKWNDEELWKQLLRNNHHEEQAGLLCALTAVCVLRNQYTAVGEAEGGYLFLPPWSVWSDWAKEALEINRTDPRLTRPIDVWINGERFRDDQPLP